MLKEKPKTTPAVGDGPETLQADDHCLEDTGTDESVEELTSKHRPTLIVDMGDLTRTARSLRDLLSKQNLFVRGKPCKVIHDETTGKPTIILLSVESVIHEAHKVCVPMQLKGTKLKNVTLTEQLSRLYLSLIGEWKLRPLRGITTAPILNENGEIHFHSGYHKRLGLWCESNCTPNVPDSVSHELAVEALQRLRERFKTFPFADALRKIDATLGSEIVDLTHPPALSESAFMAAVMTAVCRPSLPLAPGFLINAPQISGAGTGKGLLVRAACAIAFGQTPAAFNCGEEKAELDKRLAAELIGGSQSVFLDNVNGKVLKNDMLATAITERTAQVRDLGRSRMLPINSTAVFFVAGNGVSVGEDLARRFITVNLDTKMEDSEQRLFLPGFLETVSRERDQPLADVLAIWRYGRQNDKSLKSGKPLGSFEIWCRWVRDPLLALGCADPVELIAESKANDPQRIHIGTILKTWWNHYGDAALSASELCYDVRSAIDPHENGQNYVVGQLLKIKDVRVEGLMLTVSRGLGRWAKSTYAVKEQ